MVFYDLHTVIGRHKRVTASISMRSVASAPPSCVAGRMVTNLAAVLVFLTKSRRLDRSFAYSSVFRFCSGSRALKSDPAGTIQYKVTKVSAITCMATTASSVMMINNDHPLIGNWSACFLSNCSFSYSATRRCLKYFTWRMHS